MLSADDAVLWHNTKILSKATVFSVKSYIMHSIQGDQKTLQKPLARYSVELRRKFSRANWLSFLSLGKIMQTFSLKMLMLLELVGLIVCADQKFSSVILRRK